MKNEILDSLATILSSIEMTKKVENVKMFPKDKRGEVGECATDVAPAMMCHR